MYDYMMALYTQFFQPQGRDTDVEAAEQALKDVLDREQKKLLLHLTDAENTFRDKNAVDAFVAGFRLAAGIANELAGGWFSFEEADEAHGRELFEGNEYAAPPGFPGGRNNKC